MIFYFHIFNIFYYYQFYLNCCHNLLRLIFIPYEFIHLDLINLVLFFIFPFIIFIKINLFFLLFFLFFLILIHLDLMIMILFLLFFFIFIHLNFITLFLFFIFPFIIYIKITLIFNYLLDWNMRSLSLLDSWFYKFFYTSQRLYLPISYFVELLSCNSPSK